MSYERLSKLQRWLLLTLFDSNEYTLTRRLLFRRWWTQFKGVSWKKFKGWKAFENKGHVTLTRSIDNLYGKGYVEMFGKASPIVERHHPDPQTCPIPMARKVWCVYLTDKGVEKAKELK